MPILVKVCRINPTYGPSIYWWTVTPGCCLVRQQLTQRSFYLFPRCYNPKIHMFDPKSSYFSHFKPINVTKTYLSQVINQNIEKQELAKKSRPLVQEHRKFLAVPTSKSMCFTVNFITCMWDFTSGFILLTGSLVFQSDSWFPYHD